MQAGIAGINFPVGDHCHMRPAWCPLPSRWFQSAPANDGGRIMEVTVYFGDALLEASDGLETVYAGLFKREAAIREAVLFTAKRAAWLAGNTLTARYVDTITDEDRLPHYKMMASRFEVVS